MGHFDRETVLLINAPSGQSWMFDYLVSGLTMLPSVKILPLVLLCIWQWSSVDDRHAKRSGVLAGVLGAMIALVCARIIQNLGPERLRPLHADIQGFVSPLGMDPDRLAGWSSFPSDHATLSFALAFGLMLASRRLGLAAALWALLVVCLPRVYSGLHYPTDILAGALIGLVAVLVAHSALRPVYGQIMLAIARFPSAFCVLAAVTLFQIVTLFNDVRDVGSAMKPVLSKIL